MKKNNKLLKTLLVAGALIPTAMGFIACGGNGGSEKPSCGEGNHTYAYYAPTSEAREQMVSKAEENGITKKDGESYTAYVMSEKFNIPSIIYDSDYDSKGDIYYQSKHYVMCTTCGEVKLEDHDFTASSEGITDTSHNVTCEVCNYTHEDACNFKGTKQNEVDEDDGECFCGKTAPAYITTSLSDTAVRLEVQGSASGDIVIPSTYNGKTVTEVAFGELASNGTSLINNYTYNNITSLTIPASVTKVYGLDSNTAYTYPNNTFPNLTTVNIEGVINGASTYIDRFFMGNISNKLETVNAPNCYMTVSSTNVVTIKGGCASAETVNISDVNNFSSSFIDTLNIDESVTTIPENFAYTFSVKAVNAPGVTALETSAFSCASALETFNAPNLEYIGESAFYDCKNLVNIDLTNVKYIGERSFEGCKKLNNLEIDTEGTVEIEYRAFSGTALFEKFSIKATTINLNEHYLYARKVELFADTINLGSSIGCEETEEITLDGNLINFCEYGSIGTNLTEKFTILNYNVANAGEGIMDAYYPSPADVSVTYNIGAKVKTLPKLDDGESWPPFIPFREIVFDANCQIETIGSYELAGVAITEITLPDSVKEVEPCAFYASKLKVINHSNELELAHSAIYGCEEYVYTEEAGLKYFEDHTVVGTTSDADGILTIKDGTKCIDTIVGAGHGGPSRSYFFRQYLETSGSITLIMPDTITEIIVEDNGEFNSDDLGKVTLSNGLKYIPDGLFSGCWALTEVSIPQGIESIGKEAFKGTGISTISIPSTVETIGEGAFNNCTSLETVTFANGLQTIGKEAFVGTKISTLNLPASLKVIKDGAFSEIDDLTSVNFNEGLETIETNAFKGCSGLGDIVLPSTLTTLGSHAFWVSGITSVNILGSIEVIDHSTFSNCENLVSVTLPNTLETIEYGAFSDCPKLQSITLPASVTSVASYAFGSCAILETINVLGDLLLNENVTTSSPLYKGQVFNNGYYKGTILTSLVDNAVPFFYVKEGTTEIVSGVFANNTTLKAVYIPESVTTIANGEFSGCTNLTLAFANVPNPYKLSQMGATKYVTSDVNATEDGWIYTTPDSSGMTQIAGYYGNDTVITIPTNLGGSTMVSISGFEGNTTITEVIMGDNVVVISEDAFKNCTSLQEVSIGANVYMIGANAFSGCSALTTVNVEGDDFDIYNSVEDVGVNSPIITVVISDQEFLIKLTSTYVNKLWFRMPIA